MTSQHSYSSWETRQFPNPRSPKQIVNKFELDPTLASDETDWRSITLESFDLPPGQTPEHCLDHYFLAINLRQPIKLWQVTANSCTQDTFYKGGMMIPPVDAPFFLMWNQPHQVMFLDLQPRLLQRNAIQLFGQENIELLPKFSFCDGLIYQIVLALQADLQRQASADRIYAETLANGLAIHLLKHYSTFGDRTPVPKGGLSQQKLKLVTEYIHDNLERELGLQELAAIAQLSQYHFCRMFKCSTGLSPHKYVTRQRVEKAKRLLKQGSMTLAEIAVACGFTHQSHLHRHFKRQTGVTPKNWLNS